MNSASRRIENLSPVEKRVLLAKRRREKASNLNYVSRR